MTLQIGDISNDVTILQTLLTRIATNYKLPEINPQGVDGNFGPNTLAAVKSFQTLTSKDVTGIVIDETWADLTVIDAAYDPSQPTVPSQPTPIDWKIIGIVGTVIIGLMYLGKK